MFFQGQHYLVEHFAFWRSHLALEYELHRSQDWFARRGVCGFQSCCKIIKPRDLTE